MNILQGSYIIKEFSDQGAECYIFVFYVSIIM